MTDIFSALKFALQQVASEQCLDGGFATLSSPQPDNFSDAITHHTNFAAAIILCCLNTAARAEKVFNMPLPPSLLESVRAHAAEFLLAQRGAHWSFNYWSRGAAERALMPYPDDLDDTFVALSALYGHDRACLNGTALADMAKMLMAVEVEPGGPYRTWLVAPDAAAAVSAKWRDVDVAVNGNVGYFLSLFGVQLPKLRRLVEEAAAEFRFASPYYPDIFPVAYFAARFYKSGPYAHRIAALLLAKRNERVLNPLQTALMVSTLIDLGSGEKVREEDIAFLCDIAESHTWKPCAFCIDPSRAGKKYYAGSAALTAAFAVEALAKYAEFEKLREGDCTTPLLSSPSSLGMVFLEKIKEIARDRIRTAGVAGGAAPESAPVPAPACLQTVVLQQIESIKDEKITLVPRQMQKALGRCGQEIPLAVIENLALANLYGWMAYTIYDDFLDGEGEPLLLSAANYFLRELTLQYAAFGIEKDSASLQMYRRLMAAVDAANVWEQRHCRFKIHGGMAELQVNLPYQDASDLDYLANRSIGHALPALTMLLLLGYAADSPEVKRLLAFFKHYLIARQLNDDAHDWKGDLLRGQLNSVGARLVRYAEGAEMGSFDFAAAIPELQRHFWRAEIENVVVEIKAQLAAAREALHTIEIFENSAPLEELLDSLDRAARKTLGERALAVEFLRSIQNKN